MYISINNKNIEVKNGETIWETAHRIGLEIPSLCYAKGVKHKPSCMVCVVRNIKDGQFVPSCATVAIDGMTIETDSEEVKLLRTLSLELLLSDHRADCDAPCTLICPYGLDVEKMLFFFDNKNNEEAYNCISLTFTLPDIPCNTCKAPCEKACRRGSVDKAVEIRNIINNILQNQKSKVRTQKSEPDNLNSEVGTKKPLNSEQKNYLFQSRLGRFTDKEKEFLKATVSTHSKCLHCACTGKLNCKLRKYATEFGIKRARYETSSQNLAMTKQHVKGNMWFETAKCIRCGLCVYNSENGFTYKDRGFGMQIFIPQENRTNIDEKLTALCPTGALYSNI